LASFIPFVPIPLSLPAAAGSVLQSYTLNLTFQDNTGVGNILGTLTLFSIAGTPMQHFNVDYFSTGDSLTYSDSFSTGALIGVNPNTTWTLDLVSGGNPGDANIVTGWSLDITAVPEPVNVALGIFAGVFVVGGLCRTQRVRNRIHRCRVGFNHWLDAV
jgi:hypothetical protein